MNSTQLIAFFEKRKEELENPDDFNMFMEGYFLGINDTDVRERFIDEACICIKKQYNDIGYEYFGDFIIRCFRKAMERR